MNSLGTSIVNGIYRIVINQILQSPDIYYRSELHHNRISVYTGTIISDPTEPEASLVSKRGGRISLSTSRKSYALEEACTVWEGVLIDRSKKESTSTDMPLGTAIHNIEITLGRGGQLARAAGAVAKLIAKQGKSATLKLPSGEVRFECI
ncbi:hypothetical protein CXB51_002333 [Gossypium anomalum]|uniref:Large ribosomal subunit protein uL2 C-terminal domain-containing protein n=1 Tax=Gossypium anomalum TaxID=47600 RepID=A0A8J5ZLV1_9ROSI|nr:hypothetical protein CXB51_002333 [Gossypium anomalum]